jgi:hypothetical protein
MLIDKSKYTKSSLPPLLSLTVLITVLTAARPNAAPIPLDDHSFRSFDTVGHYFIERPEVFEPLDVHNITLQLSDRYYYSKDTSLTENRFLLHFADSMQFGDVGFNFRIRMDGPGDRVKDAGWTKQKAGEANYSGFVYDPDRIVAYYTPNEHFKFGFGKDRYNWGPLELGGLLLSDYNEGFTGLYQQYALGGFVLRGLTAQLNSLGYDPNPITHRYLSAAHLEYYKPSYGFAIGQSIVFAGVGRGLDVQYLFPFYIFHYGQMTDDHGYQNNGHNTFGSLDGYAKIYKLPLQAYGELLVDDFQGHSDEASQSVQNTVSYMFGLRLKGAEPWYGFIEGGKISTYSYNHIAAQMRYRINDCFIGSPLGPDQQLLWGKFGREFLGGTLGADLNFWWRRSGERHGRDTMYVIKSYSGTRNDSQPYGIIEDELSFWASASYRRFFVDVELRGGAAAYKNRGNMESGAESYPFVGVFLSSGIASGAGK